jgi:hypothetical protein
VHAIGIVAHALVRAPDAVVHVEHQPVQQPLQLALVPSVRVPPAITTLFAHQISFFFLFLVFFGAVLTCWFYFTPPPPPFPAIFPLPVLGLLLVRQRPPDLPEVVVLRACEVGLALGLALIYTGVSDLVTRTTPAVIN